MPGLWVVLIIILIAAPAAAETANESQEIVAAAAVAELLGGRIDPAWLDRQIDRLPPSYLAVATPEQVADDLRLLQQVDAGRVVATARYRAETETVQFTVGATERTASGIFHRLTGALTGKGLEIRSAEIHTLADGAVLDHFWARDPDYVGQPPNDRIESVKAELIASLAGPEPKTPSFRHVWREDAMTSLDVDRLQTRVEVDNTTSSEYTILDVFAADRPGLLHAVASELFRAGLSVARARIGTFGHQVVDVWYVTDQWGGKLVEQPRIDAIRARLLDVIRGESGCGSSLSSGRQDV